ncbi:MAG: penicillin-binding protein 2 [Actinobacteria bacterium]|nr:penicillin-binding protein 2 [Actinomycetota bacterium]
MSRQIRRVAGLMLVLFAALFVNLNVIQLLRADDLANDPRNPRLIIKEYEIERGPIVVGEKEIVHSVLTDDDLAYLRVYEEPFLYSHLTGYYSVVLLRSGLEQALNEELTGTPSEVLAQNLADLLSDRAEVGNTVRLTIDPEVQAEAARALGDRIGAVVALDPRTGAVLASYSNPSYDPNLLSSHDRPAINENWQALQEVPGRPLLDRVTREFFPPGSAFKVVVAAAALERGIQPTTAFPDEQRFDVPQTESDIGNFGGGLCAGGGTISLADALRVSCNTTFARLGVELGSDVLVDVAERFGFNRRIPYELGVIDSVIPKELDPPSTAQSGIGQRDVRWTPLHAAMIVASIANEGTIMQPHVVAEVLDPTGRVLRKGDTGPWSTPTHPSQVVDRDVALTLADMMVAVVNQGTGTRAQIPGVRVGGKTGTAQVPGQAPTVWFIGFAEDQVAVAVVLPDAGDDATGGANAAPIARAVMEAALELR